MSQLEYYGQNPSNLLPHKSGLYTWGVVLIVLGGIAGLFALGSILGATVMVFAPTTRSLVSLVPLVLLAVGMYAFIAVVLIYLGIGSCKGRRWVRPLIMILSVLAMVNGVTTLFALGFTIVDEFQHPRPVSPATPGLPANFQAMTMMCSGFFVLLLSEALPAAMLWFYRRRSVQDTLDILDPKQNWTDRCPLPVLGWSLACLQICLGLVYLLVGGYAPFFNTILRHLTADLYTGLLIILTVVGALLCYRQSIVGWVISIGVFGFLCLSYITFALFGDHDRLYKLVLAKLPAASQSQAPHSSPATWSAPALLYVVAVVYLIWLFQFFKPTKTAQGPSGE